jgi:hypothetical protein
MRQALLACALLGVVCVTDAAAQVLQPPPRSTRPTRGLFGAPRIANPNRADHELTLQFNMLGGYEDNLSPTGSVVTDPFTPRQSGTTGLLSGSLQYNYGTMTRYVSVSGRAHMNSFRGGLDLRPMFGGSVSVNGATPLGSKAALSANINGQYQPSFAIASGGASSADVLGGVAAPPDPTAGVSEIRSLGTDASSTLTYNWSRRQRTNVGYGYTRQRVTADTNVNSQTHMAMFGHTLDFSRAIGGVFSYQRSSHSSEQARAQAAVRPVDSHQGQLGVEIRKSVSPTRRLVFNAGVGALRVSTISELDQLPFEYVAPSGYAGARLDLGRTWAVTANFRRDVTVLEGLTQQSFLTDAGTVWLGGNLGRSWVLALTGGFSQGRPHEGEFGSYESRQATAQLQYELGRCCSALGSYSIYSHKLNDIAAVPAGFPNRFDRNSVSVGFIVWLPLYGSFPAGRGARGQD